MAILMIGKCRWPMRKGLHRHAHHPSGGQTVALRRQRSHVRIVSGAPMKSGTSRFLAEAKIRLGKHQVSSRGSFGVRGRRGATLGTEELLNDCSRVRSYR